MAQDFAEVSEMSVLKTKAIQRIRERDTGSYDWPAMCYALLDPTSQCLDIASYRGPVEVKVPKDGPRGVFVTRNVKAGELLVSDCFNHTDLST